MYSQNLERKGNLSETAFQNLQRKKKNPKVKKVAYILNIFLRVKIKKRTHREYWEKFVRE